VRRCGSRILDQKGYTVVGGGKQGGGITANVEYARKISVPCIGDKILGGGGSQENR